MFQLSPNYHPDAHMTDAIPSPRWSPLPRVTITLPLLWRGVTLVAGGVTVWVQVHLIWATLPADADVVTKATPVVTMIMLALSLCVVDHHRAHRERGKAALWLIGFLLLLTYNASSVLQRVSGLSANKAAVGLHVGETMKNAKRAQQRAEDAEDAAKSNMDKYCGEVSTNTSTETTPINKKRATTTSKSTTLIDPRCASWTDTYTRATQTTAEARENVANAATSGSSDGISPAAKSISQLTNWDGVTVDHALDFVQPCSLEFLSLISFLTAFSPRSSHVPRPVRAQPALKIVARAAPPLEYFGGVMAKGWSQDEVTALVGRWIAAEQLPIGDTMQQAIEKLCEWAKIERDTTVSQVTFGKALTAHGIERRVLHGRKVISRPRIAPQR